MSSSNSLSKEQKREFNSFIQAAQEKENCKQLVQAKKFYELALKLYPKHPKLPLKIKQIQNKIDELNKDIVKDTQGFLYEPSTQMYTLDHEFGVSQSVFKNLMPHQRQAVKWLWEKHCDKKIHGCVLGDDMGLGKTIEILTFVYGLYTKGISKTFLLVVPAMVCRQWEEEAGKWCPGVTMYNVHTKQPNERKAAIKAIEISSGILLTTYNLIQNDDKTIQGYVWDYIILDEAHIIKSMTSHASNILKTFYARHKISATGTPMMNNLTELWNLMDFTMDGKLLGEHKIFNKEFDQVISDANLKEGESPIARKRLEELSKKIAPYVMRRTKKDVFPKGSEQLDSINEKKLKEMDKIEDEKPRSDDKLSIKVKKYEVIVWVKLDENQRKIYQKLIHSINIRELGNTYMRVVIGMISYLEKTCSNPCSIMDCVDDGNTRVFITDQVQEWIRKEEDEKLPKVSVSVQLIKMFEKTNDKCLLFSQHRRTLDTLESVLNSIGICTLRIDGKVDEKVRKERLKRFNTMKEFGVLLMTIRVGACGLNITGASRVILYDIGWSVIGNQAVDRVFRIGQTKDVVTYRIVTCGTIEEKMYRRQMNKTTITDITLETKQDNQKFRHWFTKEEMFAIFSADKFSFDMSETHNIFLENKPKYPQNMPVYPEWMEKHVKEIESIPSVSGVSDHDFIIKTDLPDVTVPQRDHDYSSESEDILGVESRNRTLIDERMQINSHLLGDDEEDTDEDIVRLKSDKQKSRKKSLPKSQASAKTCYTHANRCTPFVVTKCRCHCTQEEKEQYNKILEEYKFVDYTSINKRINNLVQALKIQRS